MSVAVPTTEDNQILMVGGKVKETDLLASISTPTTVKDICKDGALLKMILKEGDKWESPKDLDDVLVKYEVRLNDGMLVKKSDGVEFSVKDGHFCLALSKAVKTMKKGERVILIVKPQYGFREKGKPAHGDEGSIPPNATLQITLELVSWKTVSEVTVDKKTVTDESFSERPCFVCTENPGGKLVLDRNCATDALAGAADGVVWNGKETVTTDKMVVKQILKEGERYECPNEGAVVKLKLIGKLQDGTVFFKKGYNDGEVELFEFKTDEEQVVDGLDRAVMTMKKGEVALLTIGPEYAFGSSESQQELAVVPPNSTLYYEVELVSIVKGKESWVMNTGEKIEAVSKKQAEGIALYKAQKYDRASKRFEQALKFIEHDTSFSDEEKKKVRYLKLFCNFFLRECKIILNDYKDMVVNDNSSSDVFDEAYIELLKAANDAIRGQQRLYTTAQVIYGEEANSYSYWDMLNKTKSWIIETVMKVGQRGQRMLKP